MQARGLGWGVGILLLSFAGSAALSCSSKATKERDRRHVDDDDDDDEGVRAKGSASASTSSQAARVRGTVVPVDLDLHVMSQCPYGVQAENMIIPMVRKFGKAVNFRIDYIGKTTGGELTSMHGPKELTGDLYQICARAVEEELAKARHVDTVGQYLGFIECQNKNMKEVDTNAFTCASEVGLAVERLTGCANTQEGKTLLSESFDRSVKAAASGSPTIRIAGAKYQGQRREADLTRAICAAYTSEKPELCDSIPESPKVNVTILRDVRCTDCKVDRLETTLKQKVANPVITQLEYGSADGKKLFDELRPTKLPALVFDSTLDADKDATDAFKRTIREVGSRKVVASGDWNPICADAGGCGEAECRLDLPCRTEVPKKLEVFIMSQCPFAVKGIDSMKEVLDNFKKNGETIELGVHFIGSGDKATGLTSMHGAAEVAEDLREVCAIKHYAKNNKFLDYIWCRNKDIKSSSWESCTGGSTGIDTAVIRRCSEGTEGKDLLERSFAYSKDSGMRGSPTWLANAKFKFSGIDAETIKTNMCAHNTLKGCSATLSGPPARPATPSRPGAPPPAKDPSDLCSVPP